MHLRLNARAKRTLERAAACEETSVSEFVLAAPWRRPGGSLKRTSGSYCRQRTGMPSGVRCSILRSRTRHFERRPTATASALVDSGLPKIEPLGTHHDRAAFSCGEPAHNAYLRRHASQDMGQRVAQVFVAPGDGPERIAGYYSLSAASFEKDTLPLARWRGACRTNRCRRL